MPNVKNHPLFNTQKELQDFYNLEKFIKKTHETTFSFINPNYNSNLEVNNKLNLFCDASNIDVNLDNNFINKPNSIIAGIFKSKNQDFFCYKKHIICYDNNIAELLAIYEGLQIAKFLNINHLNIYTDSSVSITFIKKHIQSHKSYINNEKFLPITTNIIQSLNDFSTCHFFHVPRKQNKQVDKLTKHKKTLLKCS